MLLGLLGCISSALCGTAGSPRCCMWVWSVPLVGQKPLFWRKVVAALEEAFKDKTKHHACASARVQSGSERCKGILLFLPLHFLSTFAWQQ